MTSISESQLDEAVRIAVYDHFVHAGVVPDPAAFAVWLQVTETDLGASYLRLAEQRALVLDADGAIAMWWVWTGVRLVNVGFALQRSAFRIFCHPTLAVEAEISRAGLRRRSYRTSGFWQVVVFERHADQDHVQERR
jgi:hypothetical protein